jgi:hypothetical protein
MPARSFDDASLFHRAMRRLRGGDNTVLATPGEREKIWAKGVELYPGLRKERQWAGNRRIETFVLNRR